MAEIPSGFIWPASWKSLPLPSGWLGRVGSIEAELQSEVPPGHLLHRVACQVVAFNAEDPNEFLFASENIAAPVAFVHLTWKTESDPVWPFTVGYSGWEAFRAAWVAENT